MSEQSQPAPQTPAPAPAPPVPPVPETPATPEPAKEERTLQVKALTLSESEHIFEVLKTMKTPEATEALYMIQKAAVVTLNVN